MPEDPDPLPSDAPPVPVPVPAPARADSGAGPQADSGTPWRGAALVVGVLLLLFGVLSALTVRRTSLTYDETLHVAAAYAIRHHADFRINPEDPPLFQRWAALALPAGAFDPHVGTVQWDAMLVDPVTHWPNANDAVFRRRTGAGPAVAPDAPGATAGPRYMMVVVGVLCGAATAGLGFLAGLRLVGPRAAGPAAVIAATLYCLDPAFLGHAPLVKNDVAAALAFTVAAGGLLLLGRRITPAGVALLAAGATLGVCTKFSGLFIFPAAALALGGRALLPAGWPVAWTSVALSTRRRRGVAVAVILAACAASAWAGVWAVYGFRYSVAPDPAARMTLDYEAGFYRSNYFAAKYPDGGTQRQKDDIVLPVSMRLMHWAAEERLVPLTFAKGFNYTYASTVVRWSYLLGDLSRFGFWSYFPVAVAVKFPLGTLGLVVLAVAAGWVRRDAARSRRDAARSRRDAAPPPSPAVLRPDLACVVVFAAFYLLSAVFSGFNLGVRHLFPVLPTCFVLAALPLAGGWVDGVRWVRAATVALAGLLAVETLSRFPDYISFFNAPARAYGPHRILADSNLDWGQGLPALADWQRRNPTTPLSLAYFGSATPEAYGITYTPLKGTMFPLSPVAADAPPGVVAVSATLLQEVYVKSADRGYYLLFRRLRPREVLADTLFLYDWPPAPADVLPATWQLRVRRGSVWVTEPVSVNGTLLPRDPPVATPPAHP